MGNFIEDNPWTLGLALIGIIICEIILPSPLQDFFSGNPLQNVTQNPSEALTGYVIGFSSAMIGESIIRMISGLIGAVIGAIIGMIIDFKTSYNSYGGL